MNEKPLTINYRRYALGLLLTVNMLNYIDRQVLFAVFPLIKLDWNLSDTQLGFLGSSFMFSYMLLAPLFGWLGDNLSRTRLAAGGLVVWSLATAISGYAPDYRALLAARATVGVGEASFGTVSPGLISDYFPKEQRGRILSWFYVAIPVGSALGYILGGLLGQNYGWHTAFLLVGLPGLLLTIPIVMLRTPQRGGDVPERSSASAHKPGNPLLDDRQDAEDKGKSTVTRYTDLFKNRTFVYNTLAMAAMTFSIGGLAQWIPSFLYRVHGLDVVKGNTMFGATTVLAGILGTMAGGWLGDRWQKQNGKGYLLLSGWGFLIGTPFVVWGLLAQDLTICMSAIFIAEFFLFLNTGPLNTVIINTTNPAVRAMAFAVNIFFIHALGDAVSPSILGWLSDQFSLRSALLVTPVVMLLAGMFCFVCSMYVVKDMELVSPP